MGCGKVLQSVGFAIESFLQVLNTKKAAQTADGKIPFFDCFL